MVNNFELIKKMLVFDDEDDMYFLQLLRRKKENSELGSNSSVIKTYYIKSLEYLNKKEKEIISLCDVTNSRACINLNRRSFRKLSLQTLRKLTEQILNEDYMSASTAYDSVCGAFSNEPNKKWIIDIDDFETDVVELGEMIKSCDPEPGTHKCICTIPTKNGVHLITRPFRIDQFKERFKIDLTIQKDNPTILYCNTEKI